MTPTEQLKEEHQGIKLMLQILQEVSSRLESGRTVDPEHLERIHEFLRIFADKCHHAKEEDLLFPELERSGLSREGSPIGDLLVDHERVRACVQGMGEALRRYQKGEPPAGREFAKNARRYIELLNLHIEKEDDDLFPRGEKALTPAQKEKLVEGFERLEVERIGAGKHEEFHRLLEKLKGIYLGAT
ncbi:MAG: hemerythrin domain-containing protein [Deltaproteobacteria bacterium]|nr:hemerythrin domain-containing protein [Deltaproteobacteria bacterium]